jgi:hypothetical protein
MPTHYGAGTRNPYRRKWCGKDNVPFVPDHDKGLKPALRDVFPNNHEMSCAKHIEANVSQKYGKQCGKYVIAIAKSFSTRHSSELLDTIRAMKKAAATYLEGITGSGILWQSTQWLNADPCLPPRYGIVTSNSSEECVKNTFAEARNLGCPEALEKILDIMSSRIYYACRSKYQQREDWDVVPRVAQILKKGDAAASLSVDELELGCGDFKVVEQTSVADDLFDDNTTTREQQSSINIVKPDMQWCSCGVWQEFMYPCQHGCAVHRKWKEKQFDYVLANMVHPYYSKLEFVKKTFRKKCFQ